MAMTIQSSTSGRSFESAQLIERLKDSAHLDHLQYRKLLEASLDHDLRDDIEPYVMREFERLFYPQYQLAVSGESRRPESAEDYDAMYGNSDSFDLDALWALADDAFIDMPPDLRAAYLARLAELSGDDYASHLDRAQGGATVISSTLHFGEGPTYSQSDQSTFQGFKGVNSSDVTDALRLFPSDSLQGQMLGFLGHQVLLGRNIQSQSAIALASIGEAEQEIMAQLANLESSGLTPDDPAYLTRMEVLKQKLGDLSSTKEMYMSYITQSSQRTQELVSLLANFLKELNSSMQQLASNLRTS